MADWYVWSGATGLADGTSWTNAFVNLTSISTKTAGDRFFVAHDHVQTQASALTITSPGTEAAPCRIYCANRAGSVPPVVADLATTATVSTTGASAINIAGTLAEIYGIIFSAGDAGNSASINVGNTSARSMRLRNCSLRLGNSNIASRINWGAGAGANLVYADNVTVQFGHVTQTMSAMSRAVWKNTPNAILGSIPTILLGYNGSGQWFIEGVDLSAITPGTKTLFQFNTNAPYCQGILKDCKLGASVVVSGNSTTAVGGPEAILIRCDSGDTNYRTEKYNYAGTQVVDTATVLTGGASDGAQPISWKITTTANSKYEYPFEALPITIWNESIGSAKTLTIQGIWGTAGLPNNDDIWIDVAYLGTSGFPVASKVSSNKGSGLATNAALPAGTGTWSGSTTKFALSVTFTPQEKGFITVYVCVAKASSIFFIDPKPVIT